MFHFKGVGFLGIQDLYEIFQVVLINVQMLDMYIIPEGFNMGE